MPESEVKPFFLGSLQVGTILLWAVCHPRWTSGYLPCCSRQVLAMRTSRLQAARILQGFLLGGSATGCGFSLYSSTKVRSSTLQFCRLSALLLKSSICTIVPFVPIHSRIFKASEIWYLTTILAIHGEAGALGCSSLACCIHPGSGNLGIGVWGCFQLAVVVSLSLFKHLFFLNSLWSLWILGPKSLTLLKS